MSKVASTQHAARPWSVTMGQKFSRDQLPVEAANAIREYCKFGHIWYHTDMVSDFEWDEKKNQENRNRHGVGFEEVQRAFQDPHRLIIGDSLHSKDEERWFCVGDIGTGIVTVRFTMRGTRIRIFGAGYWRKMRRMYYRQKG